MDQYHLAASGERDGLWDWDLVSDRVHYSPRWIAMVEGEDGEIGNSPDEWLERVHAEDRPRVRRELDAHLGGSASEFDLHHRMRQRHGTYRRVTCHGVIVRDEDGAAVRVVGLHADVTADQVVDPVTGLPNRVLFLDHLAQSIERARRNPEFLYAVLLIDLDRLASDEAPEPTATDPLLSAAARRLETCLRGTDAAEGGHDDYIVARLRSAQFALLLDGASRVGDAQDAAERVLAELQLPFEVRGRQLFARPSMGIAVSATGYTRVDDVMRDADAALCRARRLGGNRCEVFDIELVQAADTQRVLEAAIEDALDRCEFVLFYQPVLDAETRRIVGFEALARWQHPERGLIPPDVFIPIAEKTGFIVRLGEWTLAEACRQRKAWQDTTSITKDVWVSVNLSGAQFQPGIVERVGAALREVDLDPGCLVLELTESLLIDNPAAVRTLLMQLRVMGVRIGIDDFGTGHSSFAYLHQFPADFLKIDQSFVRGIEVSQNKADIVGSIARLARQLGLRVIAEGIENEAGLALMRTQPCEFVQGFLFSRAVDAETAAGMLEEPLPIPAPVAPEAPESPPGATPPLVTARATRTRVPRQLVGLAALGVLVCMGAAVRVTRTPVATLPSSMPGARLVTVPAAVAPLAVADLAAASPAGQQRDSPAAAEVLKATSPGGTKTGAPGATRSTPSDGPRSDAAGRKEGAAPHEFALKHQHVFGGCSGILRVTASGVSFASENAKDTFTFGHGRFNASLADDTLTIKWDQKTYRFKASTKDQRAQLREAMTAIDAFRAK